LWVRWDKIFLPKKWGGWGLKRLPYFAKDLVAKVGWRMLSIGRLWIVVYFR